MTYIVLHADALATAVADDPIVPAAEMRALEGAIGLLAEAGQIRADTERQVREARDRGHAEGFAAGRAEGLAAGAADIRAEIFRLAIRAGEERRQHQGEISTLALEVVRRIVGEIGDTATVQGLAERAVATLASDAVATVRVALAHVEAVKARLAGRDFMTVEGDPTLTDTDCVVETTLGRTYAGLETQLAQIDAAWKEGAR